MSVCNVLFWSVCVCMWVGGGGTSTHSEQNFTEISQRDAWCPFVLLRTEPDHTHTHTCVSMQAGELPDMQERTHNSSKAHTQ